MRKSPKVVCITERRRKQDTDLERSIPMCGEAIGALHCERNLNRIDFFLTPLFGTRKAQADMHPGKTNLVILSPRCNDSPEEGG
jgi:hypothetical protein